MRVALGDGLDGVEEFSDANGFSGYFVGSHARRYSVTELSGAADTFGGKQRDHSEWILFPRLALLPLLNGPGRLAHVIHGIPEFPENARIKWARAHLVLQPDPVGAGLL